MDQFDLQKKIKVLFILPKAQQGGAETQLLCLLKNMDRQRFEIYMGFLYRNDELEKEFCGIKDVNVFFLNKRDRYDISTFFKIAQLIRRYHIDITQTFLANHYSYIPAALARRSIPVGGIRGMDDSISSKLYRFTNFVVQKFLTNSRRFVLVSNSYQGKLVYVRKGFCPDSISVIENSIDYSFYSGGDGDKIRREFNIQEAQVLGTVSRLVPTKNHCLLINMFKDILKERDNLKLLIVGDGPLMNSLKNFASELFIADKIIFTGNRKDVPDLLSAMDLFLFTTDHEGWPNVIGEAMAAKVPIISFNAGDIERIVDSGVNGELVGQDLSKMKMKVIELLDNKKKRKEMGRLASEKIKQSYSVDSLVTKYESLYKSLLSA